MGSVPVASPAPKGRPRAGRRSLALVTLLIAVAGLIAAAYVFARPTGFEQPSVVWYGVGAVEDIPVHSPQRYAEHHFWLVKLEPGEVLALYDIDPRSGCVVAWEPDYRLAMGTGWFRDPCMASAYDLTGRCFQGPCTRSLDRLPVRTEDGRVRVHVASDPIPGAERAPGATPVTPQ
jgi:nitrite reductase/ring-hydroxylating ferredoxin subunit